MPIKNNINFLVSDIKNICKKYSLNISAKMAMAIIVEWFITSCEYDDIQEIFTQNDIIDPQNVWDSVFEVIEYLEQSNITCLVKHIDFTNKTVSYVKFDMGGERAYIDFYMEQSRSNFVNGTYGIRLILNEGGWVKG